MITAAFIVLLHARDFITCFIHIILFNLSTPCEVRAIIILVLYMEKPRIRRREIKEPKIPWFVSGRNTTETQVFLKPKLVNLMLHIYPERKGTH